MSNITSKLQIVLGRISRAAAIAHREVETISLLAVSKTFPASAIVEAAAAGQRAFGENYVQEGVAKIQALAHLGLEWHFIGPLQSNKTLTVAQHFDWVHSIDRLKIAQRLAAQRPAHLPPLQICMQVNISNEASKAGVLPADAPALAYALAQLPRIQLRGLMAIPEASTDPQQQRQPFAALAQLQQQLNADPPLQAMLTRPLDTLSMGMSNDLEAAIIEGATLVRVGAAIFGNRHHA